MEKRDIRILLVGEDGVGKTSLILSLISEEFSDIVPAKVDEIVIPADVTPEGIPTHIVDFSSQTQDEKELFDEIRQADVICVVYAVDDQFTIERISSYWIPIIHDTLGVDHNKPVILVGNKCDAPDGSYSTSMDQILPIMNLYAEIETCVECSAKSLKNISELFYYAQKAVLHPTAPLYISEEKELSTAAKKALVRIFKICDQDNDGLLNDVELNTFQVRCFGIPLTPDSLRDAKAVVNSSISEGILDNSLTLKGFLFLHTLFIQRGRHETTWTVLRKFGYDNALQLSKNYLYPALTVPKGCSTELSFEGSQFLTALFEKYDEDKDGCLSPAELQNLFSVCPTLPWGPEVSNTVTTNDQSWISYEGYLAYWVLTTLLDLPRTLEYLAYLGFNNAERNQTRAITVTRDKRLDWKARETRRTVFQCHVIGPKDVGKTGFLQGFLKRNLKQQAAINRRYLSTYAANSVLINNETKYLLLHEIDVLTPEEDLTMYELSCDVVCLMYDVSNPHSFEYCATIYKKYFRGTRLPCLIVGTKADRREVVQSYEMQPDEFCRRYKLSPPVKFSSLSISSRSGGAADHHTTNASQNDDGGGQSIDDVLKSSSTAPVNDDLDEVYLKLAMLANFPHLKHVYHLHDSSLWLKLSVGTAAAALIGFLIYRNV